MLSLTKKMSFLITCHGLVEISNLQERFWSQRCIPFLGSCTCVIMFLIYLLISFQYILVTALRWHLTNIYSYRCDINVTIIWNLLFTCILVKALYITPRTVKKFPMFIFRLYLHVILVMLPRFHSMYNMSYCEPISLSAMTATCRERCSKVHAREVFTLW